MDEDEQGCNECRFSIGVPRLEKMFCMVTADTQPPGRAIEDFPRVVSDSGAGCASFEPDEGAIGNGNIAVCKSCLYLRLNPRTFSESVCTFFTPEEPIRGLTMGGKCPCFKRGKEEAKGE